jgi:hypothetical protein
MAADIPATVRLNNCLINRQAPVAMRAAAAASIKAAVLRIAAEIACT